MGRNVVKAVPLGVAVLEETSSLVFRAASGS